MVIARWPLAFMFVFFALGEAVMGNEEPAAPFVAEMSSLEFGRVELMVARQEIEYLRRLYARATDYLGEGTPEFVGKGERIYRQVFTDDAVMRMTIDGVDQLRAKAPSGWADVVRNALGKYEATQHLVGTQLVEVHELVKNGSGRLVKGSAEMSSYVYAWHRTPESVVRIVIGIYQDKVRYTEGIGWQIYDMELVQLSSERRSVE